MSILYDNPYYSDKARTDDTRVGVIRALAKGTP